MNRHALLDTDFISKLYFTRKKDNSRMIECIIEIPTFIFYCHEQIRIELCRDNGSVSHWFDQMIFDSKVKMYTDETLIEELYSIFEEMSYQLYCDALKISCDFFSYTYYEDHYAELKGLLLQESEVTKELFLLALFKGDNSAGESNNLGEIKTYVLALILQRINGIAIYVFCSDDRKARAGMGSIVEVNCVSALAAFYLTYKYLHMEKEEAIEYFESWMYLHEKTQNTFKVIHDNRYEQINGYKILNQIYEGKLALAKSGFLKVVQ